MLIDTSALYALRSESDLFHRQADAVYRLLESSTQELSTTSYALVETVALLHRRLGFDVVLEFSEWLRESNIEVIWIDERMHEAAWERFMERRGSGLSFVDWTIVVASREISAAVFTFDSDFADEGLAVIPR